MTAISVCGWCTCTDAQFCRVFFHGHYHSPPELTVATGLWTPVLSIEGGSIEGGDTVLVYGTPLLQHTIGRGGQPRRSTSQYLLTMLVAAMVGLCSLSLTHHARCKAGSPKELLYPRDTPVRQLIPTPPASKKLIPAVVSFGHQIKLDVLGQTAYKILQE